MDAAVIGMIAIAVFAVLVSQLFYPHLKRIEVGYKYGKTKKDLSRHGALQAVLSSLSHSNLRELERLSPFTLQDVVTSTNQPSRYVMTILDHLLAAGVLHWRAGAYHISTKNLEKLLQRMRRNV